MLRRAEEGVFRGNDKEFSEDLNIKMVRLENIEAGNTGCYKDIFELKLWALLNIKN